MGRTEYSENNGQNKWIMILIGIALVLIIVLLCALIWNVAHKEQKTGMQETQQSEAVEESKEVEQPEEKKESEENEQPEETEESKADEHPVKIEESQEAELPEEAEESKAAEQAEETEGSQEAEQSSQADQAADLQETETTDDVVQSGVTMNFVAVDELVTAKEVTNLRSVPSTGSADTIVAQIKNGETVRRTGINETTGWSRVEYEGQVLYASGRLLTTDLNYKPQDITPPSDPNQVVTAEGRTITFTPCDDTVSPKMEVNLRTEPSTSQGDATVYYLLPYGVNVHRTGYDKELGWSRVEYDGKILYVVTSYIYVVEEAQE